MNLPPDRVQLAFVELSVSDWTAMVRWYVDVLGLSTVIEDQQNRFALLDAHGSRLALKETRGAPAQPAGVRLVFRVADADTEHARLAALGVTVGPPADHRREGYRAFRLNDPEGTPLTVYSGPM